MRAPLSQLYCKKLDETNVEAFISADPDHIGWQINLLKHDGKGLQEQARVSARIADRLRDVGIRSVFLLHPSDDADTLTEVVRAVRPDIFLASAKRDAAALEALGSMRGAPQVMVPIGIPFEGTQITGYDPVAEALAFQSSAAWLTTDTITSSDTVERFGCSGQTSDWHVLAALVSRTDIPVIVAGGMNPGNVELLWSLSRPAGFDAHTSVCTDGLPDQSKAHAFVEAVRKLVPGSTPRRPG